MQKFLEDLLEVSREHRQPDVAVDFSMNLLKQCPPAEREEFVHRMIEESLPADAPSEVREKMAQIYLSLMESDNPVSLMEKWEREGFD